MMKDRMVSFKISDKTYSMLKEISSDKDTSMTAVFIDLVRSEYDKIKEESE